MLHCSISQCLSDNGGDPWTSSLLNRLGLDLVGYAKMATAADTDFFTNSVRKRLLVC